MAERLANFPELFRLQGVYQQIAVLFLKRIESDGSYNLVRLPYGGESAATQAMELIADTKQGFVLNQRCDDPAISRLEELMAATTEETGDGIEGVLVEMGLHKPQVLRAQRPNLAYAQLLTTLFKLTQRPSFAYADVVDMPNLHLGKAETASSNWNINLNTGWVWNFLGRLERTTNSLLYDRELPKDRLVLEAGHFYFVGAKLAQMRSWDD
jgi:hypothetical protein